MLKKVKPICFLYLVTLVKIVKIRRKISIAKQNKAFSDNRISLRNLEESVIVIYEIHYMLTNEIVQMKWTNF